MSRRALRASTAGLAPPRIAGSRHVTGLAWVRAAVNRVSLTVLTCHLAEGIAKDIEARVLPKDGAGMTMIKDGVYRALGFEITLRCDAIKLLLLTDGYPPEPTQHYVYSSPSSMAWQNTRQIFLAAGIPVNSFEDLLARGILLATCLDSTVPEKVTADGIDGASERLEGLLAQLPSLKAIGLMGDIAIASFNRMYRRLTGGKRLIAGATYKIRGQDFFWGDIQVLPSYLHTGKSYLIERSKQRMVADDVARMLRRLT